MRLLEWALTYVKHRDVITKKIVKIEEKDDCFLVEFKDKKASYLVIPQISNFSAHLEKLKSFSGHRPNLVVLNTKHNLKALIEHWEAASTFDRFFCIMFVNPDSESETKWLLFPHTHAMVTEESALEQGLKAMAGMVDYIVDKNVKKYE